MTPASTAKTASTQSPEVIDRSRLPRSVLTTLKFFIELLLSITALYICGNKNPTHYVGLARDGSQGITLRLRYYDRTQFSADNGDTNYTVAADRLIIRKDNKVIYRQKIQVLQSLPGTTVAESVLPKTNLRKSSLTTNTTNLPRRTSTTERPNAKINR